VSLENRHHVVRLEALANEIPEEAPEFRLVRHSVAAAQPLGERLVEEHVVIDAAENFVDSLPRRSRGDACLLYLPPDTQLAAAVRASFRLRNRFGRPLIVDRPLAAEPVDRRVHSLRVMSFA